MKKVHLIRFDGSKVTGQHLEHMMESIRSSEDTFLFFSNNDNVEVETYEFEDDDEIVLANSIEILVLTRDEADIRDIIK